MPLYSSSLKDQLDSILGDDDAIYSIFLAILRAVEYAHDQGIIHRDLKLENILFNNNDDIVVTDFGLGKVLDSESAAQTMSGFGMGTLYYMAPEQTSNAKHADERSDIFSLGRILFELYSGPLDSWVQDTADLPPGIALVVNRCTNPDPSKRFQNVTSLKQAWMDLFDIQSKQFELDEIADLRIQLSAPVSDTVDKPQKLLKLLLKHQIDLDFLHETLMQIDATAVVAMYSHDAESVVHLLQLFCEFTKSQNWPFDYTDRIATKCEDLFTAIKDPLIGAHILACILEVGAEHNRWYVLRVFARLISQVSDGPTVVALGKLLDGCSEIVRRQASEYLASKDLNILLQPYFSFSQSNSI